MSPDNEEPMIQHRLQSDEMKDKYHLTYMLFYCLGTLSMVANNFFVTANDYWMYKFRDPYNDSTVQNYSTENRTKLQAEFTADFSIVSNVVSVLTLIIVIKLAGKVSIIVRLIGCLSVMILSFGVTMIFVGTNTDSWQTVFFVISIITGAILSASSSTYMVTLFQLSGKFPPEYVMPILSGQSICGIMAALVQILSLSVNAGSLASAAIYFGIGLLFVFTALTAFLLTIWNSAFFNYHLHKEDEGPKLQFSKMLAIKVFSKIKFYLMGMVVLLGCTVMLHPAVTSLVVSTGKENGNRWNEVFFVPVVTFFLFHLFDFAGRETSIKLKWPSHDVTLFIIGVCRLIFIPLIMFCNVQPRHHLPVAFNHDAIYIIIALIFAFSNGYLVNLCILNLNKVCTTEEIKLALVMVVLFMILSLGLCNFLSIAILNGI